MDDIGEQHRHLFVLSRLRRRGQRRSALAAELGVRRHFAAAGCASHRRMVSPLASLCCEFAHGLLSCIPGRTAGPTSIRSTGGSKHTIGADDRARRRRARRRCAHPVAEDGGTCRGHTAPHGGRRPAQGGRLPAQRGRADGPLRCQQADAPRGGPGTRVRAAGRGAPRLTYRRPGAGTRPRNRRPPGGAPARAVRARRSPT